MKFLRSKKVKYDHKLQKIICNKYYEEGTICTSCENNDQIKSNSIL